MIKFSIGSTVYISLLILKISESLNFWPQVPLGFRETLHEYTMKQRPIIEHFFKAMASDMIMDSMNEPEHEPELVAADAKLVPEDTLGNKDVLAVPRGPMTRARAKLFNEAIGGML